MKKRNGFFTGFILVLGLAAIITGSLFAGYKFITFVSKDAEEKFNEVAQNIEDISRENLGVTPSEDKAADENKLLGYEEKEKRSYDGPRIYECSSYIFTDRGDMLTDFFEKDSYGLEISFDADRKYAALKKGEDCYLIDANLNYTMITGNCSYFGINFEGTYLYYCSASKVCIYDIQNKKEILLDDGGFNACISPNGQMVSYIKYVGGGNTDIYIAGIDREPESIISAQKGFYEPVAVSDDGRYAFFESNGTSMGDGLICYNDGEICKISEDFVRDVFFDRNCQKVLFNSDNEISYYDVFTKEVVELDLDGRVSEVIAYGDYNCGIRGPYGSAILDAPDFDNSIIIKTFDSLYCVGGVIPEAILMSEEYCTEFGMTSDGLGCAYRDDNRFLRAVYTKGEMREEVICERIPGMYFEVMNDDLNEGFYVMHERVFGDDYTYNLYRFKEGEESEFIADCGENSYDVVSWDKVFKKCYYISGGSLYSRSDETGEIKLIAMECDRFRTLYSRYKATCFKDVNGKEFIVINDNVYER